MNNTPIDISKLKTGDILKSKPDFKEVPKELIRIEQGATYILCHNNTGSPNYVHCPTSRFNKEYIFIGNYSLSPNYTDRLNLYQKGRPTEFNHMPTIMLTHTGKRIIDSRKLKQYHGIHQVCYNVIPKYEFCAIKRKIRNPANMRVYGNIQKLRLKWFLDQDKPQPFKNLLAKVARTFNTHEGFICPACGRITIYRRIIEDGYTRAGRVFVRCRGCKTRLTIDVNVRDNNSTPFILRAV